MTEPDRVPFEPTRPAPIPSTDEELLAAAVLPDDGNADHLWTHTDLPLPQSGNSGISPAASDSSGQVRLDELRAALDQSLLVPGGPALHDVDWREVRAWVDQASRGLMFRRDRNRLVRDVLKVLDDEWHTARQVEDVRELVERLEEKERALEAGTYWTRRDGGRRAKQPTHVEVDPGAWAQARATAARRELGVGEYVGRLVKAELRKAGSRSGLRGQDDEGAGRRVRMFARLAVEKPAWAEFVAQSHEAGITVARQVGMAVEGASGCLEWPQSVKESRLSKRED